MVKDGFTAVGWTVIAIICLVMVVGASIGLEASGLTWYEPWRANKQTEVIRNTNQYVSTQQAQMRDAWNRYNQTNATPGQQRAAIDDWCAAANRVDDQYVVPSDAKSVAMQQGCWN